MKHIIIISTILALLLSGCVEPSKNEVYYSANGNETVILYSDLTWTATGNNSPGSSGTYRIDGTQLTLIAAPLGNIIIVKRNATGLYSSKGDFVERVR